MRRKLLIRASALTAALAIFALTWLAVGVRPWQAEAKALPDPRLPALLAREGRLCQEAEDVRQARLAAAAAASAPTIVAVSAPSVSVVSLPPVTQTRTS